MKVRIIEATPEVNISECAKVCYNSKLIKDGGKDITKQLVHGSGHLAVLRFAFAIVEVNGISVACQNQVVRSKHLDFMVESKRYVKANDFTFIMPDNLSPDKQDWMTAHWEESLALYEELILNGVKKEDARAVLPANTSTNMNIAGNLQAWNDAFRLRISSHAQKEIRDLFITIAKELSLHYPTVFPDTLMFDKLPLNEWYSTVNT